MIDLNYWNLSEIIKKNGYRFFTKPYDLNFVGIRTNTKQINEFEDLFCILYRDEKGTEIVFTAQATTDPGLYWLLNPMNTLGTAIMKPGNYEKLWKIGMHKDIRALVQNSPVTVYRDNNRDGKLDLVSGTEETGIFGINCHPASRIGKSVAVNKWSAGCIVIADIKDFIEIMKLVDRQVIYGHGSLFSFTLFGENDLN